MITDPKPALNDLFQSKPSIFSNNTAPKKQPKTDPKGVGMNIPTINPMKAPTIPIFVPPIFLTPIDGNTRSNIVITNNNIISVQPIVPVPLPTPNAKIMLAIPTSGGPITPGMKQPAIPIRYSIITIISNNPSIWLNILKIIHNNNTSLLFLLLKIIYL